LARIAVDKGWTVRQLEQAARHAQDGQHDSSKRKPRRDPNIASLERELGERLAARVELAQGRGGQGKLVIHYHSSDELEGILGRIH
jgi:ParB family chromosome partitioning protein